MSARKLGPYYHQQRALGAEFIDRLGFAAALRYTTAEQEHLATRERAGLYDVYNQVLVDIKGRDAESLLRRTLVNSVTRMGDGDVLYSSVCRHDGGMIDDLTCFRISATHFHLCPTPSQVDRVAGWMAEQTGNLDAHVTNLGASRAFLSIQGPRARDVLSGLCAVDISPGRLPYFKFIFAEVAGVPRVLVSRTGYSGELGYELFFPREYSEHMWDSVMDAGKPNGLLPCGLGALRSVRIEKRYPLYGLDIDDTTTPLEAGLDWTVRLDERRFIGRDVLLRQREGGVARKLIMIEFDDLSFVPPAGSAIMVEEEIVGTVTSADKGWYLGRALALGYVATNHVMEGTAVMVRSSADDASRNGVMRMKAPYDATGRLARES